MGPISGPSLVFLVCLCLKTSFAYVEVIVVLLNLTKVTQVLFFVCEVFSFPIHLDMLPSGFTCKPRDIDGICWSFMLDHILNNTLITI